ncbi:hypothetical protein B0H19DRAFT_1103785 [Mycena capillaripes]|nr:hypothetical protein B0H19DRAFT_1103785 [Mycena capillaripes]
MASESLPKLPFELTDLVINNIDAEDRRTLGICGLVCHPWLALSRPILFRSLWLDVSFGRSNAHAFSVLLRRRDRVTFLSFVKEIKLTGRHPWTHTVLPGLVSSLPAFTTLHLRGGDAATLSLPFKNLRHLVVPSTYGVLPLLDAFPVLEHFGIDTDLTSAFPLPEKFSKAYEDKNFSGDATPPALPNDFQPLQRLHTVELDYDWDCKTIKYIMGHTPPLTTFSLACRANNYYTWIQAAGPTLRTLRLIFPQSVILDPPSTSAGPLTPQLQTLRLCAQHKGLFHIAANLLSTVNLRSEGPELLELELGEPDLKPEVSADDVAANDDDETAYLLALAELDRVVQALSGLTTVHIRVHAAWNISVSLPLCRAAGKLL